MKRIITGDQHGNTFDADGKSIGVGDTIAKLTGAVGIRACPGCKKRQQIINNWLPYKR
jgi:hypothetical protein